MTKKNVFISIGSQFADQQGKFLDGLIDLLRSCDIEPRVINKTDYPTGNPLKDISRIMRECQGVIIVAYERTYFDSGIEKRKSPQEKPLESVRYTTPWNQIEASMAFALGLPIIVMMEKGLREEGLLEEKYDWYVERLSISADAFSDKDVRGRIMAWCRRVQTDKPQRANHGQIDAEMTVSDLGKMLTLKTVGVLVGAMFGIFVFGVLVGQSPLGDFLMKVVSVRDLRSFPAQCSIAQNSIFAQFLRRFRREWMPLWPRCPRWANTIDR
jgi:hypothetical protein